MPCLRSSVGIVRVSRIAFDMTGVIVVEWRDVAKWVIRAVKPRAYDAAGAISAAKCSRMRMHSSMSDVRKS